MLNLEKDSWKINEDNRSYLNKLKESRNPKNFTKDDWDITKKEMKAVKKDIKTSLITLQDNKCAYCTIIFEDRKKEFIDLQLDGDREHIAPKSKFPNFIFTENNLVLSCQTCNRTLKNDYNTVIHEKDNYKDLEYNIVHPYFDNYKDHIIFDNDMILCIGHKDNKGENTIKLFQLKSPSLTTYRAKEFAYKEYPYLVSKVSTLKKDLETSKIELEKISVENKELEEKINELNKKVKELEKINSLKEDCLKYKQN